MWVKVWLCVCVCFWNEMGSSVRRECLCVHVCVRISAFVLQLWRMWARQCLYSASACVCMCKSMLMCSFPSPLLLLLRGGRGPRARRPVSSWTPSSSPLSARQLGSGPRGTWGCGGLTFALNPVTSALPSPMPGTIHMQATHHQPILLFQLSTPGQAVVSSLKFKSWDEPGHPGPGQTTTDQVWGEGGRGTSVWLLIFYGGQREMVWLVFGG